MVVEGWSARAYRCPAQGSVMWCGVCDLVWYGVVWCCCYDMVWCGVV